MTVGRRLTLSLTTLLACTALLGAASVAGVITLRDHYRASEEQYAELRALYEIGSRAASLRQLVNAGHASRAEIEPHLLAARQAAESLDAAAPRNPAIAAVGDSVRAALSRLDSSLDSPSLRSGLASDANRWLSEVTALASRTQSSILERRRDVTTQSERILLLIAALFGAAALTAAAVGLSLRRAVMRPLGALDAALSRFGDHRLDHRVAEAGDAEFRRLMRHFNHTAQSIETLHASMQRQVEAKSRELLRSEQLASVGSLAAGLAHEINNPLAIIVGHAQSSLRRLDRAGSDSARAEAAARAAESLRIINDEAFRCRDIAVELLGMARPADQAPEPVELDPLARRALELVRHLPIARGREIIYRRAAPAGPLTCRARAPQVLQVLINLLTNALEACPKAGGRVELALGATPNSATLTITDNGRGMDHSTLARAFNPFFTTKPKRAETGAGLGLSLSHAIAQQHGGRLTLESPGLGRGTVATLELPAQVPEGADAAPVA